MQEFTLVDRVICAAARAWAQDGEVLATGIGIVPRLAASLCMRSLNHDLMMTDSSETLYQQKLNPQLCAVHPDKPFDFAEKAYWLQRDIAFKEFADQWLHLQMENGGYNTIFAKWFN